MKETLLLIQEILSLETPSIKIELAELKNQQIWGLQEI